MKRRLQRWFRHLLILSITAVGASAAIPAKAHDLPIFDSTGLFNCFGIDSPHFEVNPNVTGVAASLSETTGSSLDWTSSGWSWSFVENKTLANIKTEDRPEFTYLGPASTRLAIPSEPPRPLTDSFSPVREDWNAVEEDSDAEEPMMCGDESIDCEPSKQLPVDMPIDEPAASQVEDALDAETLVADELVATQSQNFEDSSVYSEKQYNYLRARKLVDDYLEGESFVRDWRNLRPFKKSAPVESPSLATEYAWVDNDQLAQAVPHSRTEITLRDILDNYAAFVESVQCHWSQEMYQGAQARAIGNTIATGSLGLHNAAGRLLVSLGNKFSNNLDSKAAETNGSIAQLEQPLFAIHRLDGKEFLLPSKQAEHWNCVPELQEQRTDWKAIAAKSARVENFEKLNSRAAVHSRTFIEYPTVSQTEQSDVLAQKMIERASVGMKSLLGRVQGIACQLRLSLESAAQVAERIEAEEVR